MSKVTYYSDISGEPVELKSLDCMPNAEFSARWPGLRGQRYDGYQMWIGRTAEGEILPMTRRVFRKANPSNHRCSARCLNAKCTGRSECECECGGRNHGLGMFANLSEAMGAGSMSKITQLPAPQPKRGTYRYASLVLDAWDRLFSADDRLKEREQRQQKKEHRSQVEQAAKQRL